MNKKELQEWIEKNELSIKTNEFVIEQCRKEVEFAKKIIEEIKKIPPINPIIMKIQKCTICENLSSKTRKPQPTTL